ncbi:hypothetical protein PILCRDRAFT_668574 [Piloderma croceum F 1598]|uniref:Uncharacterized protein n=1 Tax=Piloderma croceum (strain F 1598) TaxID=765440 RepID=A0A0C3F734_PILCF|nr:hypothetical protein PILCRDRAFT_668574 [Piloderma croceum F 1598]
MPNPFLDPIATLSPRSSPSTSDHAPTLPQIQVSTSPTISLSPIVSRSSTGTGTEGGERRFEPPPGPPPPVSSSSGSGGSGGNQANGSGRLEADDLDAEAPPAYTPAADVHQGESTLEVGPRRPFQQVRAQPSPQRRPSPAPAPRQQQQQPYLAPQTEWDQYQRHTRQGQWAQSNPSLVSHQQSGSSASHGTPSSAPNSNANLPPPPPRHPHSQNSTPLNSNSSRASEAPVSDFARDFYAAGGGDASESLSQSQSSSSNTNRYAPPPGPPPQSSTRTSNTKKNKNKAAGEEIPDDGRPTQVPTPGHPLLLNSKLLVYPVGFECHKCNNTGFKNFDPTHPCRKCWERYSRPYVGAITYTPWSSSSSSSGSGSSSSSNTHFQRPLPKFKPPQQQHLLRSSASQSHIPSHSQSQQHARSISNPNFPPHRTQYAPSPSPSAYPTSTPHGPPPGSTVVRPGDPRIGGTMCYKCLGSGVVQFFIFEDVCVVCRGVGRVF